MKKSLFEIKEIQIALGLCTGIVFGFLLQKGGVTNYDIIIGQLLLTDFTVLKIMLSAVVFGMIGVHLLKETGLVTLQPKTGSIKSSILGGFMFGIGFGILGYCPGTIAGALGNGYTDAIPGGVGIIIGAGLFASQYHKIQDMPEKAFKKLTIPEQLNINHWIIIIPVVIVIILLLGLIEKSGL
ncbi:DUF6691 family protein [Candidatus Altiarchaeota archaeon]